ncbi:MAG: Slp family lipoprotein [Gammaproteobacteria bacterium]|nr:Slp family lipoprotein [Gammaproteobacteria bacterium]
MVSLKIPLFWAVIASLLATGCASPVPDLIKKPPVDDIRVEEVQTNPHRYTGSTVRWGGSIIQVENLRTTTLIEILSRRLLDGGQPVTENDSQGRFKIILPGFAEPGNFPKDRLLTVRGKVTGVVQGNVGAYLYTYPLVESEGYYLWPEEREYRYYDRYDPFYYPWYPYRWYGYPYYWY